MSHYLREAWAVVVRLSATYGMSVVGALAIVVVGFIFAAWAGRATRRVADKSDKLGPTLSPVLSKAARMLVLAITLVAVLDKLGVDTTSIVAALGALGLGIGLALKDTLGDLAAGIVLLILRPFEAGHDVEVAGIEGKVTTIDLFETKLVGTDGVPVSIANKKIRDAKIRNFSEATRRRFDIVVGVAYGEDIDRAIALVTKVVAEDERVLADPAPIVNTLELADSSVNIVARVNLTPSGAFAIQLDLRRKLKQALDEAAIEIPFPQRVIHHDRAALPG